MKKFFKFLAGFAGLAAVAGGVLYALNKKAEKEAPVEDDDFTEDFEDPFFEDENRAYTSIPVATEEAPAADAVEEVVEEVAEAAEEVVEAVEEAAEEKTEE